LILSFIVVQASDHRARLGDRRAVSLPASAVLDECAQPLIAASGKVGFISSVTDGTVLSFSVVTGRILSSIVVGETVGPISMVEAGGHRYIAATAANNPAADSPATVTIIDATSAKRLEMKSLLVLPAKAIITQATRAMLTRDGRFCLVASSFDEPTLFAFDVETGQRVSELKLGGRPSEIALFDDGNARRLAVASAAANRLSILKVDEQGALTSLAEFTPAGARFDESNNPAFSSDGQRVYIAAASGDQLYLLDAESGIQLDSIGALAPERITVARVSNNIDLIAATNIRRPNNARRGGVTIFKSQLSRLFTQTEFAPPAGIEFSRTNNVVFTADASMAFVGSATGVLFAFNTETGDLESYQAIGNELRRVALSEKTQTVAAVRSAQTGDEVVIINFDLVKPDELDPASPVIDGLSPSEVEQGRIKNLQLVIKGQRFTDGASVIVNGAEIAADLAQNGKALEAKLPRTLFDQLSTLSIQVKGANGVVSSAKELKVIRPGVPVISQISPREVAGPSSSFMLRITGQNFRPSSTIFVAGQALNTQQLSATALQAVVPADIVRSVGQFKVFVRDLAVSDLVSVNSKDLTVYGPRITELRPMVSKVVAGDGDFTLRIRGDNFQSGAQVQINGEAIPAKQIRSISRSQISLVVPKQMAQEAGKLNVQVLNADGNVSDAGEVDVRAPQIMKFAQTKVLAGRTSAQIDIRGQNFRRRARVYVGNGSDMNVLLAKPRVRFRNSTHLVVTLTGELSRLMAEPGKLEFNVVNPNSGDGVSSQKAALEVAGPAITSAQIEAIEGNDNARRVVVAGANFRKGAMVEFVKGGAVLYRQAPDSIDGTRLTLAVPVRRLEAMGSYRVRVVNPGNVTSIAFQPHTAETAVGSEDD